MSNPLKLYAPKEYWDAITDAKKDDEKKTELEKILNGCGAEGWKSALVPETLWGLSVTSACNIHDWMYTFPKISTIEDKELADRVFLNNMVRIINHHHENDSCVIGCILKKLRLRRARIYYEAVSLFGGDAFWAGKNTDDNFQMLEERDVA